MYTLRSLTWCTVGGDTCRDSFYNSVIFIGPDFIVVSYKCNIICYIIIMESPSVVYVPQLRRGTENPDKNWNSIANTRQKRYNPLRARTYKNKILYTYICVDNLTVYTKVHSNIVVFSTCYRKIHSRISFNNVWLVSK